MLFGTYRNPESFEAEAGFWHGASKRMAAMLAFRDVSRMSARSVEHDVAQRATATSTASRAA
jgi:hypothetical protein